MIPVPGQSPIRLEIYYTGNTTDHEEPGGIGVYAAGTLVADGFRNLAVLGMDHAPWTDARLTGLVDYGGFNVAPGTRRGVIPDEATEAFVRALAPIESVLAGLREGFEQRKSEALDRTLIRDLEFLI